jgi:hypothetical protein
MKRRPGFSYALLAITGFLLFGCDNTRIFAPNPRLYTQDFFDKMAGKGNFTVIQCGAFVKKTFGDKNYEASKANVCRATGSAAGDRIVVGIVHEDASGRTWSVHLDDLNTFLETGDMSVFGKPLDLTVK